MLGLYLWCLWDVFKSCRSLFMRFREDPVQALTRSLETIAMLDEACARVDLAKLATAQGNQDALAVQALYWNALLGTDRFAV